MGFINYNRSGDIVVIEVRDYSGAKIDTMTCQMSDKKKYAHILKYLKEKYGFEPEAEPIESSLKADSKELEWWE